MTAAIIPIGSRHRCAVCGGRSVEDNRLGMSTDANGKDVFLHLDCMSTWAAWRQSTCRVCGEGDYTDDPIGIFLDGKGGEVALHQACWSAWATPAAPAWANPLVAPAWANLLAAPAEDTDCLFCGGGPDGDDTLKVFAGSEDADWWIHSRCRDGYVELWREQEGGGDQTPAGTCRAVEIFRSAKGEELTMVQVTPDKPGETRLITDPTAMRFESELQALTAAVNEIAAFIASERQTYMTRLKPGLESDTTDDTEVWEISEDSHIHMQCLEHNLQAALNRLLELKKSTAELLAGIELSQDKCAALFDMEKEFAPIIN
jgi:hypothetical protein